MSRITATAAAETVAATAETVTAAETAAAAATEIAARAAGGCFGRRGIDAVHRHDLQAALGVREIADDGGPGGTSA